MCSGVHFAENTILDHEVKLVVLSKQSPTLAETWFAAEMCMRSSDAREREKRLILLQHPGGLPQPVNPHFRGGAYFPLKARLPSAAGALIPGSGRDDIARSRGHNVPGPGG